MNDIQPQQAPPRIDSAHRIYSLDGLKLISIALIIWWHSWLPNPSVDLGARCCEFFFVTSGFLVAHSRQRPCTWRGSLDYVFHKLETIWPMHFLAFLLMCAMMSPGDLFTRESAVYAVLHLTLLQSWFYVDPLLNAYNGLSWFLSALMFCYFVSPLLTRLARRSRRAYVLFPLVFLTRYALEELPFAAPDMYWHINMHMSPVVRVLEFFMGVLIWRLWADLMPLLQRMRAAVRFWVLTAAEIAAVGAAWHLLIAKQNTWGRDIFSLWFCVPVLVFAFDGGLLSRLLAVKPIRWLSQFQFQFYIFHAAINRLVDTLFGGYGLNCVQLFLISLSILFCAAVGYRKFLSRPAQKGMSAVLCALRNWLTA